MSRRRLLLLTCVLFTAFQSQACILVNPSVGWEGYFAWNDGFGDVDAISEEPYCYEWGKDVAWTVAVEKDISVAISAHDDYIAGDEFGLVVNGANVPWEKTFQDNTGFFHGVYESLLLTAGTHDISFTTTSLAPGFLAGAAHASFSPVESAPVPEPGQLSLTALGFLATASLLVRKNKQE